MHEALFYTKLENLKIKCLLCPHECLIASEKSGKCKVRFNLEGTLYTMVYNKVAAIHIDPVEKKPLYHFYPGKNILSIGEVGCNFNCSFCQNSSISQCFPDQYGAFQKYTAKQITEKALNIHNNIGVAYTYNEPFTFYEFMLDCAKEVSEKGLKNVVVSNGYINQEPLKKILPYIDAFNIDLKAFNQGFYKHQTKGSLKPVLECLNTIVESGKHLEITNLVISNLNDSEVEFENMVQWISTELGKDTPLHISRYFPNYRLGNPPTPISTLEQFYLIATNYLDYVYLGNVFDEERSSTYCPQCKKIFIKRGRFDIEKEIANNICFNCGYELNITV